MAMIHRNLPLLIRSKPVRRDEPDADAERMANPELIQVTKIENRKQGEAGRVSICFIILQMAT